MEALSLHKFPRRHRQAAEVGPQRTAGGTHLPASPSPLRSTTRPAVFVETGLERSGTWGGQRPGQPNLGAVNDSIFAGRGALAAKTPRPATPGVALGSSKPRPLYSPNVATPDSPSDDESIIDSYFSPRLKGSSRPAPVPTESFRLAERQVQDRYQPSPAATARNSNLGFGPQTPPGRGPNEVADSSGQANLLATPRTPAYLAPTLNRTSWVPLGVLTAMVFATAPMSFGSNYAALGVFQNNVAYKAAGFAVAAAGLVGYWAAVGVGLHDTLALRPSMSRDVRLRALGSRGAALTLCGLALGAPLVLMGATFLYNHAYFQGDHKTLSLALIPANVGRTFEVLAAGSLYTIMQMRRGWTPVKVNTLAVFCATAWACTTAAQFGISNGEKDFPRLARQLTVLVPFYLQIVGLSELFARLNFEALQRGLTDNTPIPWEGN